jgi:hypothetical protein
MQATKEDGSTDLSDAIPKVELQCHVERTVRPSTVVEELRPGETAPR